jgi:hypothetical protein
LAFDIPGSKKRAARLGAELTYLKGHTDIGV